MSAPGAGERLTVRQPGPDVFVERLLANSMLPRVLVRTAECTLLSEIDFKRPVLDIGSGDGTFANTLFSEQIDAGIDPAREPMLASRSLAGYRHLAQAMGDTLPFRDGTFATVFSNSTLEHIPDPAAVLREMSRVAQPGAACIVTVPSEHFPNYLLGSTVLNALRLRGPAARYGDFFNQRSRHIHIEPPNTWRGWLEDAGLQVQSWRYYFSHRDSMIFDLSHYLCIPSLLTKAILGSWVLWPGKTRILPYRQVLKPFSSPGNDTEGAYLFFHCRKP